MAKGKNTKQNKSGAPKKQAQAPIMTRPETGRGADKTLTDLDFERQAAQRAAGQEESTYGIWRYVWKINQFINSHRKPHKFKKKTYMWLMLFTGFFGGHRWYQGRYILAALMTAFFWTGIPTILLVTDLMEVIPIKPDEDGYIILS